MADKDDKFIELVKRARLGDSEAVERLAETAR